MLSKIPPLEAPTCPQEPREKERKAGGGVGDEPSEPRSAAIASSESAIEVLRDGASAQYASELKERSTAQEHFIDLCRLLGEPTPAEADPKGHHYCPPLPVWYF